jgi:hypothetical protein
MSGFSGQKIVIPLYGGGKIREILIMNKQILYRFHVERFSLKKLNEAEGKEWNRVKISNRCAALENLDNEVDIIIM